MGIQNYRSVPFRILAAVLVPCIGFVAFAQGPAVPSEQGAQILDHPFPYDVDRTEGPLAATLEFLNDAGGLPGGVVLMTECGDTPSLHWSAKQGTTFRQVFNDFQASNPDYQWEVHGSVLNLLLSTGIRPLLSTKIKSFDLHTTDQQTASSLVFENLLALPEIREAAAALDLKEGTYLGGLMAVPDSGRIQPPRVAIGINVQLRDASLQDAFNAIAQAYGHTMWIYEQRLCQGQVTYTLTESRTL